MFPTFEEDKLVFKEKGIELGDWNMNRKASVDVPISKVNPFYLLRVYLDVGCAE